MFSKNEISANSFAQQSFGPELPEWVTGDQLLKYRRKRGPHRYPDWDRVEEWRRRWTAEKVKKVLELLSIGGNAEEIGKTTDFGTISVEDVHGKERCVPDLRGLDISLLSPEDRRIKTQNGVKKIKILDLSYARLEGARLTDLDLSQAILYRAHLQKATLRRTNLTGAVLTKVHFEDADLRGAVLENSQFAHVRYTEDSFWWHGTIFRETHLTRAFFVDPLLERYAKDQYYLYVLKYRKKKNWLMRIFFFIWWFSSDYGKNLGLWVFWCVFVIFIFWMAYLPTPAVLGEEFSQMTQKYGPAIELEEHVPGGPITYLYFSVITFTTLALGNIQPGNWQAEALVMSEVIAGYIMLGFLLSVLGNKIVRKA